MQGGEVMAMLVRLLGAVVVVMGLIFGIKPEVFQKYVKFWNSRKRIVIGGIISFLFGVVFLLSASRCRVPAVITILGIWAIIKGIILFVLKERRLSTYLEWWSKKPLSVMRLIGIISLAFGILIIWCA